MDYCCIKILSGVMWKILACLSANRIRTAAEVSNHGVSDTDQSHLSHYSSPAHRSDYEISIDKAVKCFEIFRER